MATGDGRYITIQDVKDEIPDKLLKWATYGVDHEDQSPTVWTVDETKIAKTIRFAEGDVDSKICKRYRVPLDLSAITDEAARDVIVQAALLLTVHKLYDRIGHGEDVRSRLAQALSRLDGIATGNMELPGAEKQARKRIYHDAPKRVFGDSAREGNLED